MLVDCIKGRNVKDFCKKVGITEQDLNDMIEYDIIPGKIIRDKMCFFLDKKEDEVWETLPYFEIGPTNWTLDFNLN